MTLPTQIKRLKGTLQPCRTNPNEPEPMEPLGNAPATFTKEETKIWRELKRMCVPGLLTIQDRFIAELLCQLIARLRERDPPISPAERSCLTYCLSHLGLTPVDRAKCSVAKLASNDDDISQFLN